MTFVKHENFPDEIANLIRHLEYQLAGESRLKFPQELYGEDVKPDEWLACVANQARSERPLILTMEPGIRGNLLTVREMKQSRLSYVVFLSAWATERIPIFAWRALKVWPDVVEAAERARTSNHQCCIDVPVKGRIRVRNL